MIKLGSFPYLNLKPLIWGAIKNQFTNFSILYHIPSSLSNLLNMGVIDVGMVPIFDYFKNENYRIIKGIGIGSKGKVRSILFYMKKDIRKIENIGLDISSSTSSNLLRILLSKKYNIKPRYITVDFGLTSAKEIIKNIDSFLLIGDNALNLEFDGLKCLDLGEEWYNWTGLPFTYAVWMTRKDIKIPNLDKQLLELKEYGLNKIDEIVEESVNHYHFTKKECREYFTNNIKYDLTDEEIKGINLFYKFAQELKLSNPNKELKFYGDD